MVLAPSGIMSSVIHCPRSRTAVRGHHIVYRVTEPSVSPFNTTRLDVDLRELNNL